jgi:hypothetical protein
MEPSPQHSTRFRGAAGRAFALVIPRRLTVWGLGLLALSWGLYIYVMSTPGFVDRANRFKGTDYIYFYVMGSLAVDGRMDALYDPAAHLAQGRRRIDPELRLYAAHSNYGPQVALAFAPLALLPFGWSLALFLALSAGAYALSVRMIWRGCPALAGYGWLVALLAAASPLFLALVRYAQLSAFTLLFWTLALVALRRNRRFAAGLAIGCLAYKPQMGLVIGVVLIAARDWRAIAGALVIGLGQFAVAWVAAGSAVMVEYLGVLWTLLRNPSLVQLYPSEVHSLRGFLQLLMPSTVGINALSAIGMIVLLGAAVRAWMTDATYGVRWGLMLLLTVLASPHLLAYDLVLLTLPMLAFADWAARSPGHPSRVSIGLLLVVVYFAPFSGNLARVIDVQLSVVVMALLAWHVSGGLGQRQPHASGPWQQPGSTELMAVPAYAQSRRHRSLLDA